MASNDMASSNILALYAGSVAVVRELLTGGADLEHVVRVTVGDSGGPRGAGPSTTSAFPPHRPSSFSKLNSHISEVSSWMVQR
jgi:hypothetical protein